MAGADSKLELPGKFDPAKNYLVGGDILNAWREALVRDRVLPGPGQTEQQTDLGRIFTSKGGGGGTTNVFGAGEFEELYELGGEGSGDWYVRGGTVRFSNKKSIRVPDYAVDTSTDGQKLLYIHAPVEIRRTTDEQWPLPGIKTSDPSSLSSLDIEDTTDDEYPEGEDPDISDGKGVTLCEVGTVIVTDGVPIFIPTGVGPFILNHCFLGLGYENRTP